jgi:DNA-binding beta-propeller fold protein YncE
MPRTPLPNRHVKFMTAYAARLHCCQIRNAANHRVFIGRQNRVMVIDENDGKLLGEVTGINGAHGTAIAAKSGHGFATSGNDSSIVMFDLTTFKVLGRAHAAEDADAIIYDAASNRVFSLNGDAHSSTVIDPATGKFVTNIPLGTGTDGAAFDPQSGDVFASCAKMGPAPAESTAANPRRRPQVVAGSFSVMVIAKDH